MALNEFLSQQLSSAVLTTVFHPLTVGKVLIQAGFEPYEAVKGRSFFWKKKYYTYPNILKYLGFIKSQDGFFGLYRGWKARIAEQAISQLVSGKVEDVIRSYMNRPQYAEEDALTLHRYVTQTTISSCTKTVAIIISQPFHVVMVRMICSFVGHEQHYSGLWSTIVDIYNNEGVAGFFSGLVPRVLGEVVSIWMASGITYIIHNYVIPDKKDLQPFICVTTQMVVSQMTYPFTLVSNVMAMNTPRLAIGSPPSMPRYSSWTDCWRDLASRHELKRGASMFFRAASKHLKAA